MTLGQKISTIRKEIKLSQGDIAEAVGVSRDAISKYERDDIIPSVENAKKIAEVLNVSLDYLVSSDEKKEVIDKKMVNRIIEIQRLTNNDQNVIVNIIDAFIRDAKTRQAYAS